MLRKLVDVMWELKLVLLRIRCFFTGHEEVMGNVSNHEDDYCKRCLISWPGDKVTLPDLLNRLYSWMVERDWLLFNCLDDWLYEHYRRFLPYWWSY